MGQTDIKNILNYYLEYEIYRILSNSEIKINNKTSFIVEDILNENEICKNIDELKIEKIKDRIEKFVGNNVDDIKELVNLIQKKLINIDEENISQVQTSLKITDLIKKRLKNKIDEKVIQNFVDELFNINESQEFLLYAHNIRCTEDNEEKRLAMFIFKCKIENEKLNIIDVNVNIETIYKIISIKLDKELSDIKIEYEENILNYSKEIKTIIDAGDIEHILYLCYSKLYEYVDLSKQEIKNIQKQKYGYKLNEEYIMSLDELVEVSVKNIKEDIEILIKLINNDNYIPNVLKKYLNGSIDKNNINNPKYTKMYRGNYKTKFGVGQNQYKIVNTINDNELIAIEGPPGTGKTSLLKEIIANKIVERADLILKNWDKILEENKFHNSTYYNIDWYNNNEDIIKSIVVSSKNSEAIENVGREINQEIRYMFHIARKYKRKKEQKYKGIICLPLGKKDNLIDFKEFLYNVYIPMLEKYKNIESKIHIKKILDKIKENYSNKCNQIKKYEYLISSLNHIKDKKIYFYGIDISYKKENEKEDFIKIQQIQEMFQKDKEEKQIRLDKIKDENESILKQIEEEKQKLEFAKGNIKNKENEIRKCQKIVVDGTNCIENLKEQKQYFNKISKNIFTKILNYKEYKKNKGTNFSNKINEIEIANKIESEKISQYIKDKSDLEKTLDQINNNYNVLNNIEDNLKINYQAIYEEIKEMRLIEEFNRQDKNTYWNYANNIEIYGKSTLSDLNQELFELSLDLNEAYILKNSDKIIENLKLFLPDDKKFYICKNFYDSSDIYNSEKQRGIRCLWNTLFLCFPVITTTLDSFSKRCFNLIPEYIDLELIDEAGQILPHNLVSAIYRAKKAVIVGDVNQIEPIYNNVSNEFHQYQKSIGEKFDDIKIESNSIQALANKNTDILNDDNNIILNDHYRCEENIINFSNENVYLNRLNMHIQNNKDKPFYNNMIALDVRGKKDQNENLNKVEVESCIKVVNYIREQNEKEPSIAIITPFKKQKKEIENELKKKGVENVKVGTVHSFQGQEKDYIIFSSVIDSIEKKSSIDFIGKKCNMLNVAVTRAKKQFIYLGNLNVAMQAENYITKLVKYINKNGLVYSLYNIDEISTSNNLNEEIYKILQPELKLENDNIGLYIKQYVKNGIITDAKKHYEFLRYVIKNTKKEIYIMSPFIRTNVINNEFLEDIRKLKEKDCKIKIIFGYKKGNKNVSNEKELARELKITNSLGFATQEEVEKIAKEMYKIIGRENFIYAPPTHAKILIIDNKYMCIGSHNWLSNAGKQNDSERQKEATRITTSEYAMDYAKEEFFEENKLK